MKDLIPAQMQTDLEGGATHHALCWQLVRRDAQVFGFTNHDKDLTFDSVTYKAETGMNPSAIAQSTGLNIDNMDVMGVLNQASIDEDDIASGQYDNALITCYLVDWRDTSLRSIILAGSVGEISRGNLGFVAEVRGLAHALNQKTGDTYTPTCRVDVGTPKCGVNLAGTSSSGINYTVASTVTFVNGRNLFRSDTVAIQATIDGWFSRGVITWTSGANAGAQMEIKTHVQEGDFNTILLWEPMPYDIEVGDAYSVTVGCDGAASTCFARFDNLINFRGFNLIPGNDIILRQASSEDDNSGGSVF